MPKKSEKAHRQEYYLKNRDKFLKGFKDYYKKNKEKILKERKLRYKKKKEFICSYSRKYQQKRRKKYLKYKKNYYLSNKNLLLQKRKKYQKNYPERIKALSIAQKIKIPKNQLCQICHEKKANQKHHFNYQKPLKVNFLCKSCHKITHFKNV